MISYCCASEDFLYQLLGFDNLLISRKCDLIFQTKFEDCKTLVCLIEYFQNIDPYIKVAHIKKVIFFEHALKYLAVNLQKGEKNILDVGCAFGYFLDIAPKDGLHVSGVKITDAALKGARKKMGHRPVTHRTLSKASLHVKSFDEITLWDILAVFDDPLKEIETYYRLLNNGVIGIRVRKVAFQKFCYHVYRAFKAIRQKFGMKNRFVFHPYCFNAVSLESFLSRVGFKNIQISNSPLSSCDQYGHIEMHRTVNIVKRLISFFSKAVFVLRRRKWIIGPSLLLWAQSPEKS